MAVSPASVVNNPAPASEAAAVTVGVDFVKEARALYIGAAGDLTLKMPDGDTVAFVGLVAGTILPVRCKGVTVASASPHNTVALF